MPPLAEWITVVADFGAAFTTLDWCEARQSLDRATIVWDDVTYAVVDTGASWYYDPAGARERGTDAGAVP